MPETGRTVDAGRDGRNDELKQRQMVRWALPPECWWHRWLTRGCRHRCCRREDPTQRGYLPQQCTSAWSWWAGLYGHELQRRDVRDSTGNGDPQGGVSQVADLHTAE